MSNSIERAIHSNITAAIKVSLQTRLKTSKQSKIPAI